MSEGMKAAKISVIIPISRQNSNLTTLLSLQAKHASAVEFILVIDNPTETFVAWVNNQIRQSSCEAKVVVNERNLGAAASRNTGLDHAVGDLIIFLDDDIIPQHDLLDQHLKALDSDQYLGALGFTKIPFDLNKIFERAIDKTGFSYAYTMSQICPTHSWGPTCNLSIVRKYLTNESMRFDSIFPKEGGGEDVDLCWRLKQTYQKAFKGLPAAKALHPPWEGIKGNYKRFNRWGKADVPLFLRHTTRRYRDFPNFMEFQLILMFLLVPLLFWFQWGQILLFFGTQLLLAFGLCSLHEAFVLKTNPVTAAVALSTVLSHELGRIEALFRMGRPWFLFTRTLYFDKDYPWRTRKRSLGNFLMSLLACFISGMCWLGGGIFG
ncbi:MAG: glycosyltransferase [Candidatus Heimdallarchaeota archaeon]